MATVAAVWDDLLAGEELAYTTEVPARQPDIVPFPEGLNPRVRAALEAQGLSGLYRHQTEAFEAASRGEHLVVSTGTASGKTLAFNLPVLDVLAAEPKLRALYLYPTKALAQDQARALSSYGVPRLRPAIYDGDTETERRWQIRKWANVILTNPDMLHVGVAPASRPLGRRAPEPPLRRGRRGARLPRGLRLARGQRPAAAAAGGLDLRCGAPVPAGLSDDRQSGRAR